MSLVTEEVKPGVDAGADAAAKAAADKATADAAVAAKPVTVEDQRAFLVKGGAKAEELAKLSEADLKTQFDTAKAAADAKGKEGAPTDGKYTFKTPDGVKLDETLVTEFSATAKELNLSPANAQKLIDIAVQQAASQGAALVDHVTKTHNAWTEASRSDKEFGGEKFSENLGVAKRGLKALDPDGALLKVLDETGLGSHPEVIRALFRHGKTVKEDTTVTGKPGAPAAGPRVFSYPNSQHNT